MNSFDWQLSSMTITFQNLSSNAISYKDIFLNTYLYIQNGARIAGKMR